MVLFRIVRADPVSSKNVTGTPLIVAAIEKEELGLTIDHFSRSHGMLIEK